VAVKVTDVPAQILNAVLAVIFTAGTGLGFTVMVTCMGVPGQPLAVGVMVYTAVPATAPVVVNVCAMVAPLPLLAPETPVCVTVQAKVVPATLLVNAIEEAVPEQIV
jgi:hypothetical protein